MRAGTVQRWGISFEIAPTCKTHTIGNNRGQKTKAGRQVPAGMGHSIVEKALVAGIRDNCHRGTRNTADLQGRRSAVNSGPTPLDGSTPAPTSSTVVDANCHTTIKMHGQPAAAEGVVHMRTFGGQGDGLYVASTVQDKPCNMIVDTDATVSIMNSEFLGRYGGMLSETPFKQLQTATGRVTQVHGCVDLDVTIGQYHGRHTMLVADVIDYCILGLDFLQQCQCHLDMVGHVLELQGMQIKLAPRTTPMGPMCQRIVMT